MKPQSMSVAIIVVLATLSFASSAQAQGRWKKNHPRRAEVNQRLRNQDHRVDQGEASGKLNERQADRIENQDARIRAQEQRDAAQNGGHITKVEQRQLNREENRVSREIRRDERRDERRKDRREDRHEDQDGAQPVNAPANNQ